MNRERFMNLRRLPTRLTQSEAGWYLGFSSRDIAVLVAAKILRPLGSPGPKGEKYFALFELEALRANWSWLVKASNWLVRHGRGGKSSQ